MDIFETLDKVGETVVNQGKLAAKKAKEVTENVKIANQVFEEEKKIKEALLTVGKIYYQEHKDMPEEEYVAAFRAIEEAQETIAELKGVDICNNCGAQVDKKSVFCNKCGEKLSKE